MKNKPKSKKKESQVSESIEDSTAIISYAKKLFKAADALRKNIDAAEYKHPVLGLIFLKYISDAFEERHQELIELKDQGADPEERSEYLSEKIFWVPEDARWSKIQNSAKKPEIGTIIDDAMIAIERDNDSLKGVLPKNYARPQLDKANLGRLVDLFSNIPVGGKVNQTRDVLGRIYEYFLGEFASKEGKKGGQFYTPSSVVHLLVKMIQPKEGRLYEPCCGSGGMIVQSERFLENNNGELLFFGQESNQTTWRLCNMNLAIRGIDADIKWNPEGSFIRDEHPNLKADYILANPPFNDSDWGGDKLREDVRWKYGIPAEGNANYAWIQHFIHHLTPDGIAGFVLANGSLSSNMSNEGEIRQEIINDDLVDCMVALPNQLFFSTPIPACLWFVTKSKTSEPFRNRKGETLFIDARKMGHLVDKTHREFDDEEITRIANTYHAWKGKDMKQNYQDIPGFCKSATLKNIAEHRYALAPGRYSGTEEIVEEDEPFEEKLLALESELQEEFEKSKKLEKEIKNNLKKLLS